MPHVTFVHGLANKPPHDVLLKTWLGALEGRFGGGLDLRRRPGHLPAQIADPRQCRPAQQKDGNPCPTVQGPECRHPRLPRRGLAALHFLSSGISI